MTESSNNVCSKFCITLDWRFVATQEKSFALYLGKFYSHHLLLDYTGWLVKTLQGILSLIQNIKPAPYLLYLLYVYNWYFGNDGSSLDSERRKILKFLIISVRLSNLFLPEFKFKLPVIFVVGHSTSWSLILKARYQIKYYLKKENERDDLYYPADSVTKNLLNDFYYFVEKNSSFQVLMLLCFNRSVCFWFQTFSNK